VLLLSLLAQNIVLPALTPGMLVVFGIIAVALVFFVFEVLPIDLTALGVMLSLMLLEPWTDISTQEGLSGFSSTATITVLAMFVLSEGIRRTGFIRLLGNRIVDATRGSSKQLFAAVTGLSGGAAGFINNTPVVAMMIPMVINIAKKTKTSPSTYLIPVSYAAMMGGMLTLIGTSTNLLASDISARLLDHPISMFEFTHLGALLLVTCLTYLFFVGRHLVPKRIEPERDLTTHYEMKSYMTEVRVRENSPLIGHTVSEAITYAGTGLDADIVHMMRDEEQYSPPIEQKEVRPGDRFLIRTGRDDLVTLVERDALEVMPTTQLKQARLDEQDVGGELLEVIVIPESDAEAETLRSLGFQERFQAPVLAIRRGPNIIHQSLADRPLKGGDVLLVMASQSAANTIRQDNRFAVVEPESEESETYRTEKIPVALGIVAGVVGLAAFNLVPILMGALGGMIMMVVTGCLKPKEVYRSINWPVIFLLAGMIPLGVALEQTGGAEYLAMHMVNVTEGASPLVVLIVFYLFTSLITNAVSNNASVVIMIPIAIEAAQVLGAEPFSFVLAVTFASSTALLSPLGYQTNLMVYGPGGYKFTDFFRVGALLQVLLAVVTALGIYAFWGV
jgi:di/tricarboxylate transporter